MQDPLSHPCWADQIAWISHYLPHQGPLQHFVHHNPLQALETYPFEQAGRIAKQLYGGRYFLEQKHYLAYLQSTKITPQALQTQLENLLHAQAYPATGSERQGLLRLLEQPPTISLGPLVDKQLAQFTDQALMREVRELIQLQPAISPFPNPFYMPTYRELIQHQCGTDIDDLINPWLAKLFSAYADPGSAYWPNENKRGGLWGCFQALYQTSWCLENPLAQQLYHELQRWRQGEATLEERLTYYCERLQLSPEQRSRYLLAMALRLRGWASLFNQLEHHPEQGLDQTAFSLTEFLLVKLVFEYVACRAWLSDFDVAELTQYQTAQLAQQNRHRQSEWLFLSLHYLQLNPDVKQQWNQASEAQKQAMIGLLQHFLKESRLSLYQQALELTYAEHCLPGIRQSARLAGREQAIKPFQYITCIDDREESLRRYIEQLSPSCETFGIAGYFEMNMWFQGYHDIRPRKLCPGSIQADFTVRQNPLPGIDQRISQSYARLRRGYSIHSRGSFWAYLLTLFTGPLSLIPFFIKVFFPQFDWQVKQALGQHMLQQEGEDLVWQRQGNPQGLSYWLAAEKVARLLKTIGLTDYFSDWIYIVGHGSSSINNPHEYAYNCGACGGGTGRANARVFAQLANHKQVRDVLRDHYGLMIPSTTRFVAGYHDTCKDQIEWFDQDVSAPLHEQHRALFAQALALSAAERGRKFFNLPLGSTLRQRAQRVAWRFNDLTEARPEYNHATNALCVIGRRSLTRHAFLDRRAFLCSYQPQQDPDGEILEQILTAAFPVCSGINLEYYFSTVDPDVYGCGSKLNHNITCHYAVMSGFASDLRLGLSKQMVEIHDPCRMLFVIESSPEQLAAVFARQPYLERLAYHQWVQVVVYQPGQECFYSYQQGRFGVLEVPELPLPTYTQSEQVPTDASNHIPFAVLRPHG